MYDRAQVLLEEENQNKQNRRESTAIALRLKPKNEIPVEDYYPTFLDMLKNVLDGNLEATTYEDSLREMFGIHAYVAFTLDRVSNYGHFFCEFLIDSYSCYRWSQMPSDNCNIVSLNEEHSNVSNYSM